ncbi:MAG: DUF4363 family protein [Ruminococcaceae bacterium]|nr:DUF4363 family protein [Oscillospiraceae bacterium]
MKSFYIALCAFVLLFAVIACNYVFINQTSDELERRLTALDVGTAKKDIAELNILWERKRVLMSFSIPNAEIQAFQERLTALQYAVYFRDPAEFERCRALALGAVSDLRRLERFSVENLL